MATKEDSFDVFELLTAFLLGLAATATALVAHENALWSGKSTDFYSESATLTSKASNLDNSAVVDVSQDSNIEIEAKKLIREGLRSDNADDKEEALNLASYLLTGWLTDEAYKAFELPADYRDGKKTDEYLPEETLVTFLETEGLDDEYTDTLFGESEDLFEEADKSFAAAREANDAGDKFSFAAVLYAISLFFAGIASVLRSRVRWLVWVSGMLVFVSATGYSATLSWLPLL
jgi:hypothetical protein